MKMVLLAMAFISYVLFAKGEETMSTLESVVFGMFAYIVGYFLGWLNHGGDDKKPI